MDAQQNVSIIERFPPELQLSVFDLLGYLDLIRLSQVSHYFHGAVDPQRCPVAEKSAFVHEAQHLWKHNVARYNVRFKEKYLEFHHDGYACFSCFRVLPRSMFSIAQTSRKQAKSSNLHVHIGHTRFCIDCGFQRGIYKPEIYLKAIHFVSWLVTGQDTAQLGEPGREITPYPQIKHVFICPDCESPSTYQLLVPAQLCVMCCRLRESEDDIEYESQPAVRDKARFTTQCDTCKSIQEVTLNAGANRCMRCRDKMCKICFRTEHGVESTTPLNEAGVCSNCPQMEEQEVGAVQEPSRRKRERVEITDVFEEDISDVLAALHLHDEAPNSVLDG